MMPVVATEPNYHPSTHAVWSGLAGSGVSTALMDSLATLLIEGSYLAESVWVLLPQYALVAQWKQQWQTVANRRGIPSALGVRVFTLFEWQLHWLNQYFMLATTLIPQLALALEIVALQPVLPAWQAVQTRWDTVGEASLIWLLKTCPLLPTSLTARWGLREWEHLLASCLFSTPVSESCGLGSASISVASLREWFFTQTVAKGWLPKAWIAPLYNVLLQTLNQSAAHDFSGMQQQVRLLILDEVQQIPLEQLKPLLATVTQSVWMGLKIDPISLEASITESNTTQPSATLFTQTRPDVLTALQQWGWHYTLMELPTTVPQLPVATVIRMATLARLAPEMTDLSAVMPVQPTVGVECIHRIGFETDAILNDWVKQYTATMSEAGYSVGVLVPSPTLKRFFQTQLGSQYAPLESQWLQLLTLCLTGWQLAMQGKQLPDVPSTIWEWNSITQQPLLQSWVWVTFPQWAEQLQQWQTGLKEALLPFCTPLQWQQFWQETVQLSWQTVMLPSHWLTAWVKVLSLIITQLFPPFAWQRVYLPLLNELQSLEVQLGTVGLCQQSEALTSWLESFVGLWTLPTSSHQQRTITDRPLTPVPQVLTYTEAVGHRFDKVVCPYWIELPEVRSIDEMRAFDATETVPTEASQWLPKTVLNEVLGAWATSHQQLVLLEKTTQSVVAVDAKVLSAKALFLQQLLQPVLIETLQIPLQQVFSLPTQTILTPTPALVLPQQYCLTNTEPVHSPEKPIYLSVSGLQEYLACPKRYYYSRVLKLPTTSSEALLKGNLLHLIMEQFNLQATPETHCVEQLLSVAQQILQVEQHRHFPPSTAILTNEHYQAYVQLPRLMRFQLQQTCLAGLANLEPQGYFLQPITHVQAELNLPDVELTGLTGVRFKMLLDAVLHHPDGTLTLVDYKAYGSSKYTAQAKTVEPQIREVLEPLPLLADEETGYSKAVLQHRHYQLALYAYGLQDMCVTDAFKRLARVGLQLLRPQAEVGKLETGSRGLYLPAEDILRARAVVLDTLQTGVINPLRNDTTFAPNPSGGHCEQCPFTAICPATGTGEDAIED
jgi:hypothetical protein